MNDLIDRKAAIDAVNVGNLHPGIIKSLKSIIEEIPSAQQWTPVTEGLPKITEHHVSEVVICYLANGAYCFGSLEENIFGQVGWDCERDDEYHQPVGEVVAWMPLPEPYEGGDA